METVALNDLWQYIQTLHLTSQNRQWLVDKLLSNNGQQPKGLLIFCQIYAPCVKRQ